MRDGYSYDENLLNTVDHANATNVKKGICCLPFLTSNGISLPRGGKERPQTRLFSLFRNTEYEIPGLHSSPVASNKTTSRKDKRVSALPPPPLDPHQQLNFDSSFRSMDSSARSHIRGADSVMTTGSLLLNNPGSGREQHTMQRMDMDN